MAQPAVGIAARACLHTLRALTIAATTNAAAVAYKGVVAPAIIAGTLAGCGGKLLSDSLDSLCCRSHVLSTHAALLLPPFSSYPVHLV